MKTSDIKTTSIDGAEVVAVAARESSQDLGGLAYALTIAKETRRRFNEKRTIYHVRSHMLSSIGWEFETGGMQITCDTEEEARSHIAEWVADFQRKFDVEVRR